MGLLTISWQFRQIKLLNIFINWRCNKKANHDTVLNISVNLRTNMRFSKWYRKSIRKNQRDFQRTTEICRMIGPFTFVNTFYGDFFVFNNISADLKLREIIKNIFLKINHIILFECVYFAIRWLIILHFVSRNLHLKNLLIFCFIFLKNLS